MPTRRRLAQAIAEQLISGQPTDQVLERLAAYLVVHHQQKQLDLIVRDIETELAGVGFVRTQITTAYPLTDELRSQIRQYIADHTEAKQVVLDERIDEQLIGGMIIETSDMSLDTSVRTQLQQMRAV